MKHCQIIVRGVVIAFFGQMDNKDLCSETAEYQDLEADKDTFHLFPIKNYHTFAVEPMLFPEDVCDVDQPLKPVTVYYFFGGQVSRRRGTKFTESPLNRLVINWNPKNLRQPTSLAIEPVNRVKFEGNPTFSQRIPNKAYI